MDQLTRPGTTAAVPTGIETWLSRQRSAADQRCRLVSLDRLDEWRLSPAALEHRDKAFFSVVGINSHDHAGSVDHALILQPEIGILGFLVAPQADGQTRLLVQAKVEPGNVGEIQVAPTVQATVSNYTRAHGGLSTPYLEHFLNPSGAFVADTLQSEQGTCFIGKYNRNVMRTVPPPGPTPVSAFWRWWNWDSVKACLVADFGVNTDARSVLACGDWEALAGHGRPFERAAQHNCFGRLLLGSHEAAEHDACSSFAEIQASLEAWRNQRRVQLTRKPLPQLRGWHFDRMRLANDDAGIEYVGVSVQTKGREVPCWNQPLLRERATGEVVLLCQVRRGLLHFLLRPSHEPGFREGVQFGASLQTNERAIANDDLTPQESTLLQLLESAAATVRERCLQSDEGGRFYRRVSRYSVVEIGQDETVMEDTDGCWVTLAQIRALARLQGMLTNEARSALSLLLAYL